MQRATEPDGPVTISIARRIIPGREAAYEKWVKGITAEALDFPGHMGVNVLRPTSKSREYITIFRYDSYEHMKAWEDSPNRSRWLAQLEGIIEGEARVHKGTGLEFWFSLPELPNSHPSPHKMAVVLLVVVFTLVMLLNYCLSPFTGDWPLWARVLASVFCQVMLMTYVVMPRVTLLLKNWLFGE
jgi:antibiotic biosynthesis monooxygenase (ABM) superfamily enzyme